MRTSTREGQGEKKTELHKNSTGENYGKKKSKKTNRVGRELPTGSDVFSIHEWGGETDCQGIPMEKGGGSTGLIGDNGWELGGKLHEKKRSTASLAIQITQGSLIEWGRRKTKIT